MFDPKHVQIYVGEMTTSEGWPTEVVAAVYPPVRYHSIKGLASIVRCPFFFRYDKFIRATNEAEALHNAEAFLLKELRVRSVELSSASPTDLASYLEQGGTLPWDENDPELDPSTRYYIPEWLSPVHVVPPELALLELSAFRIGDDGSRETTEAALFRARYDEEMGYWGSVVICPFVSRMPKKIWGIDAEEAHVLAEQFLRMLLDRFGFEVTNEHRMGINSACAVLSRRVSGSAGSDD